MPDSTTENKGPKTGTGQAYVGLSASSRLAADTADWVRKIEADAAAAERAAIRAAAEELRRRMVQAPNVIYTFERVLALLDAREP